MCDRAQNEALERLALLGGVAGRQVVAVGRLGLRLHGLSLPVPTLEVAADAHPEGQIDGQPLASGGWSWRDPGGLPVAWIMRRDHYAPLYAAAIQDAVRPARSPLDVAPLPLIAAMLLAGRDQEDAAVLTALMAAGHLDPEAAREAVARWLGVYALDDLEPLIQEAEWQAMRQRYEGGQQSH